MTEWLLHVEVYSMAHFARGCVLGLILWIIGLKWIQPKFGMKAGIVSFAGVAVFSLCWEIRDQIYSLWGKSDPFDPMDIVCDMLGVTVGQLWHLATHRWDK